MTTILAQIAPQRSTQYTDLVTTLAPYELLLSDTGKHLISDVELLTLGKQKYLKLQFDAPPDAALLQSLDYLAMTNAYFRYYEALGEFDGPFLKPIEVEPTHVLPPSLIETRRYRGKTNELFTQFMCNLARESSDFRSTPWHDLTLLDPLAGGGTTLFVGLMFGADVIGVENDKKVVDGTVAFLKQYMKEGRISAKFREDRIKQVGKRWFITLEKARCIIGRGDTTQVRQFANGVKRPQLIVTDLPYGIQHSEAWVDLLVEALPAWHNVLVEGGAMVFSWNASRLPRDEMIDLVQSVSDFRVLNNPPYNQLTHRVDRVIKQRDVIVARL